MLISPILGLTLVIAILAIGILKTKRQLLIVIAKNSHSHIRNVSAAVEWISRSKSEEQELRHELRKHRRKPSDTIAYILLFSGAISLVTSVVYSSSTLAFIGLGLTFWGALFLFIKSTKYVKASLLDSTAFSLLSTVDQILTDLNYRGKAIYLPPKYVKTVKSGIVFISSEKGIIIPPAEEVAKGKIFLEKPKGICITPPGLDLANLYEKELKKDFAKVDLNYLQNNLPKLFIEDLEIAEDLEMNIEDNMIKTRITGSIHNDLCNRVRNLLNIRDSFGCPICSSVAVALARSTGKPIVIEKTAISDDGKTFETHYRIL